MGEAKRRKLLEPNYGKSKTISHSVKKGIIAVRPELLPNATRSLVSEENPQPLLKLHGYSFAALARFGYEEKGRGMLVMPGLSVARGVPYVEMFYLTSDEISRLPCLGLTGKADCLSVINKYEPDKEVAICFVFAKEYEIVRSANINPIDALSDLKDTFPVEFKSGGASLVFPSDQGDLLVFTRGVPSNWDERAFPSKT